MLIYSVVRLIEILKVLNGFWALFHYFKATEPHTHNADFWLLNIITLTHTPRHPHTHTHTHTHTHR